MKLADHAESIRQLIDKSFRNRLGRMGISENWANENDKLERDTDHKRIKEILLVFKKETGDESTAYEKLIEEFTFTLFNRIAALKVIEANTLYPEIVTRQSKYGDRSFAHYLWLEQNPDERNEELEGLVHFMENQLTAHSADIPLFSLQHPFHLLPSAIDLNAIINAFNQIEKDDQVESEIWKSDDVLGWLYESYNNNKKNIHKESGDKTEFNKVSIQSQIYTPRWVVKFLVDNSLGKHYLEMYPESRIKEKYLIANAPIERSRNPKSLTEIKLIDPVTGSGNFLLYAFDLFYDFYMDQVENYEADYEIKEIPELIIKHNLYGIDLDDRAIQLAQFGLFIKAKKKQRSLVIKNFNLVSSDFYLPDYEDICGSFHFDTILTPELETIVKNTWEELQKAYKFGSLIRLDTFGENVDKLEKKDLSEPQLPLVAETSIAYYSNIRNNFFNSLKKAISEYTSASGNYYLKPKTKDAIIFLELLTQKYDVAVANPPYTDSGDFGSELKKFIDANYKKPFKFNSNLYAAFIKRCYELINDKGKTALIHPLTFMYIKSFEDVRKYIIEKSHINIFVDYGLSNLFGSVMVDPAFYVLEKDNTSDKALFISLDQYTRTPQEKFKKDYCLAALKDYVENKPNKHNYLLDQSKLKIIEGWPFIYWISDGFREKFKDKNLDNVAYAKVGINSGGNERFVRFWWEVDSEKISKEYTIDKKKWVGYAKGGPFGKWYGNLWLKLNWENNGKELRNCDGAILRNEDFYFKEGITYSASGSKGVSFRYLPKNFIFDVGGSCIFPKNKKLNFLFIGLLNSNLSFYIADCLNPTVNTQVGDLKRIPFVKPSAKLEENICDLSFHNIEIKKLICSNRIIEINFVNNPLTIFSDSTLRERIITYLNFENYQLSLILINEAIINQLIFEVYILSPEDRFQVETKMGKPVGELPVLAVAREAYLAENKIHNEIVMKFIHGLTQTNFEEQLIQSLKTEFVSLYQSNYDLEEFCIRHQMNPINVWYWFKESKILPQGRTEEIALEFLTDAIRSILMEDDDGIIPLVGLPGEIRLLDRLEQHCLKQGFTSAQFMQLDSLLGRPLNEYIEHYFFKNFSDHLNLFMYLPKTPFIWHLSSGVNQGFEVFIIIYKWNSDSLFKLKSQYLSKRVESLEFRQIQLADSSSAQAQNEKDLIRLQLQEIKEFTKNIDELISEGYDPKLDDGVGKNIAPLQKKGILRCDVLNKKQLEKYLNADW